MLAPVCFLIASALTPRQAATVPAPPPLSNDAIQQTDVASFKASGGHLPVLVHAVDPKFSKAARKSKPFSGYVEVALIVDINGKPQEVRVVTGIGMGLDEAAVEAVKKYRFKPATEADGQPVATPLFVDVNFQIF